MKSMFKLKLSRKYTTLAAIVSLFSMVGAAIADTSSFSISQYPGMHWNALALGVDPANGNSFVVPLSYGGEDNLYKFSSNGSLIYSKRVDLGSGMADDGSFSPTDAVVVNSNNIYVSVLERHSGMLVQNIVHLNGDGDVLSSFPVNAEQRGLGYKSASNTFDAINYGDRNNPMIVEFGIDGSVIQSFRVNDPYLSLTGGHTIGAAYNPFNQSIYTANLNQTGISTYDHALTEYKLGNNSEYYVNNVYDLRSVGINHTVLAMDINRSNGQFYLQENNSRVVAFSLNDLTPMQPIPEPEAYAMMLAGLGMLGFLSRRRKTPCT